MSEELNKSCAVNPPASAEIGGAAAAAPKAKWDMKGKRNLILVGCVIVVAVLLMLLMFSGKKKDEQKQSVIPEANNFNAPGILSAEDRSAIKSSEKKRIDRAMTSGNSALEAPLDDPGVIFDAKQRQRSQSRVVEQLPAGAPATYQQSSGVDDGRLKAMTGQVTQQMMGWGMLDASSKGGEHSYVREAKIAETVVQAVTVKTSGRDSSDAMVVEAFEKAYSAQTLGTFDSDTPGIIRARLLTGPLAGAVLTGTAQRMGDGAHFAFSVGSYKGKSFKVNAEALDEQTASDVVNGTYNGRYAQRFVFPVLAEGIKAYASARAQTGTQVVVIPVAGIGGAVGAQQTPSPSAEQARQAMLAASADATAKALATTNQQPQVVVAMRKTIGILFLESVYESDLAGKGGF